LLGKSVPDDGNHFPSPANINARSCSLGIFAGFAAFFIMEKSLRVLGGGEGHAHSHDHSDAVPEGSISSAVEPNSAGDGLRSRRKVNGEQQPDNHDRHQSEEEKSHISGPSKLSAYLNLFGDFVHNM